MRVFQVHGRIPLLSGQLLCTTQPLMQQANGSLLTLSGFPPYQSPHNSSLEGPCGTKNSAPNSPSADTLKTSLCEVNLEDVPMELVTSEEDCKSEYTDTSLSTCTDSVDDSVVEQRTTELDEIELRSRALRSMLLQKKTTTIDAAQSKPEILSSHDVSTIKYDHSKVEISCDSTARQRQKFVITLNDSSDSDDSLTYSVGAVFKGTKANNSANESSNVVNASNNSSKISRFHQEEKLLLERRMELLRFKLTVRRQQHLIDERRKIVRKLSTTLSELRKRIKATTSLYKEANKSLQKAQRTNAAYQRRLATAQKLYSDALNSVNRSTADVIKTGFALSSVNLRRDLIVLSLDVLQRAKVVTWFLAHYRLDSTAIKCNIECVKPSSESKNEPETPNVLDPFRPVCPFFLNGECLDKTCIYQHFQSSTNQPKAKSNSYPRLPTKGGLVSPIFDYEQRGKYDDKLFCELCGENLVTSSSDSCQTPALQRWHTTYLAYLCSKTKKQFYDKLFSDFKECNADLCAHLIFGLLLNPSSDKLPVEDKIVNCLKSSDFPLDALKTVLRHPRISIPIRKSIMKTSTEYLVLQFQQDDNQSSNIESSFIYLIYQRCLLEQEVGSLDKVGIILIDILQALPKESKLIFVLWWLRLHHQLIGVLPPENLSSTANMPYFSKSVLLSSQELIEAAVIETGISENLSKLLELFSSNSSSSTIFTCFLSVVHLYIQTLNANSKFKVAADTALSVALFSTDYVDDLFFPSAVYSLFCLDSSLDWTAMIASIPDKLRVNIKLEHRIEFGFLLTCLNWRKKPLGSMESHLIECLGNLIFLPKDDNESIISAYKDLLNIAPIDTSVNNLELGPRSSTYLWLSYSLYIFLHSLDYRAAMDQLLVHYKSCLETWGNEARNHTFIRLLALMIIFLANHLNQSDNLTYFNIIRSLFIDNPLQLNRQVLPTYFFELVQQINVGILPPGIRSDMCVQLVETYGSRLVPSLCRTLCAVGDHFLAQSLCAIGCLDKPDDEDFWLLYASISFNTLSRTKSSEQLSTLLEILTKATTIVTSSCRLWKYYALAVRIANVSVGPITNRAKSAGMYEQLDFCAVKNLTRKSSIKHRK
uniref:C3H1-type domain-containing protein n=1 Tax=Trichobilharzia regenti TaxID=157069 RepID=A0AA85JQT1_TRIRE|nr:unnamed protein product [Trichobilharzia regenti]